MINAVHGISLMAVIDKLDLNGLKNNKSGCKQFTLELRLGNIDTL